MTEKMGNDRLATEGSRAKRSRRPSIQESQARIGELAVQLFTANPSAFWSFAPDLANSIDQHLQASSRGRKRVPVFDGYMTGREREFKLRSLAESVEQYRKQPGLSSEEARHMLALAAALQDHAIPYKQVLLEIVEQVLGLPMDSPKPEKIAFVKGKSEHHTFELVRGLTLSLAWDGALIAIGLDPIEYQRRRKALSIIGIAADTQNDVAENHDAYLWDDLNAR